MSSDSFFQEALDAAKAGNPHSTEYLLGIISGQMRELIHAVNGLRQTQEAIGLRVAALELAQERRNGALAVGHWFTGSPLFGWIFGAAAAVWALLSQQHKG